MPHPVLGSRRRVLGMSTALCAIGVALACAADPPWQRPGASAADLERDRQECFAESGNTSGIMNWETSRYVERCLRERGWSRGESGEGGAPAEMPPTQPAGPAATPVPQPASTSTPTPPSAPTGESLTFDQCFERCRALTDRSKEACFDVCLGDR